MSAFSSVADSRRNSSSPAPGPPSLPPGSSRKRGLAAPGADDHENVDPAGRLAASSSADDLLPAETAAVSPEGGVEGGPAAAESEGQRLAREAAESEALVWRLVREEQERAYRLQMECMRNMAGGLSEEDRRALETAIAEGLAAAAEPEEEEEEGVDVDAMDYEQLLELGQAMGDVRKEVPA